MFSLPALTFPDNHLLPALLLQSIACLLVSLAISFQLRFPELLPRFWQPRQLARWLRMTVPKAAVNKNHFPTLPEHKIWSPWKLTRLKAVAVAHSMHHAPDCQLGLGVLAADAAHTLAALRGVQCVGHVAIVRASVLLSVLAVTP